MAEAVSKATLDHASASTSLRRSEAKLSINITVSTISALSQATCSQFFRVMLALAMGIPAIRHPRLLSIVIRRIHSANANADNKHAATASDNPGQPPLSQAMPDKLPIRLLPK